MQLREGVAVGSGVSRGAAAPSAVGGAAEVSGQNRPARASEAPDTVDTGQRIVTIGVSIPIPEPAGSELQRWRASFGDPLAGLVPAHITLLPPTQLPTIALDQAEQQLSEVAATHHAFDVLLRGSATFLPLSPVVFVAVARGIGDCERLQRAVRSGVLGRPLSFPYHPHVTVAHDLDRSTLDRAFEELADYSAGFRAEVFTLYEQNGNGAWEPRSRYQLG